MQVRRDLAVQLRGATQLELLADDGGKPFDALLHRLVPLEAEEGGIDGALGIVGELEVEPMHPTGEDPVKETLELHDRLSALLDEAIDAYPVEQQPPGSWWLPASRGGSAPTPERARELDAEEKAARAARKAKRAEQVDPDVHPDVHQDGDPTLG